MKEQGRFTFGGSSLDRAGDVRAGVDALARLASDPAARAVVFWRGKPLIAPARPAELVQLPMDHPVLAFAQEPPILLGREDGAPRYGFDISSWNPQWQVSAAAGVFLDPTEQRHPDLPDTMVFAELRRVMTWLSARDAELAATCKALLEWHKSHAFCARCGAASVMAQAGWQRVCPACNAPHFPRTDPVVIMLITHGNDVLMGRSPGWPDGMYSLLAGFVEPGETLEAAVRREVQEETGVQVGRVGYLASQPWPFPASLMIGCFGHANSVEINIDPVEIEDAKWIGKEQMMTIFAGHDPVMLPPRKGAIAQSLLENWLADRHV